MEFKGVMADKSADKLIKSVSVAIAAILFVFETIICVQYEANSPSLDLWKLLSLIGFLVILDVLCFIEMYFVKTLAARIAIYCIDFVFLLFICVLTGSTYIAGLYCVILSQFYLNVKDLKSKIIVFVISCVMFVVTCVLGWTISQGAVSYAEILDKVSASVVGIVIIAVHFVVGNFLISFYRNNITLKKALKEADESKKQLEEAYQQLSETAVFQERNRIARDIHDNAGHSMTAVIMQTEAAKLLIDSNPEEAKAKIISANIQAKNALEQMRESVHLLAGRDSSMTLKAEMEEILAQTMDGTGVKIRCDISDLTLTNDRRRFFLSSLKECLSNGMRHGGADAFYVEFGQSGEEICLTVSDNGSGLPEDFKEGYGLRGIREKAAAFSGGIVFESESGDGCEIKITIMEK